MKRLLLLTLLLVGLTRPVLADLTIEIVGGQEGADSVTSHGRTSRFWQRRIIAFIRPPPPRRCRPAQSS